MGSSKENIYQVERDDTMCIRYVVKVQDEQDYKCTYREPLMAHIEKLKNEGIESFIVERHIIETATYTKDGDPE